jgi:tricarballylate dehydrogenase
VLRSLGMIDPHLIATIAEDAPKALKWLEGFGVTFDYLPLYFLSQSTTRMGPIGGGLALIEALGAYVDAHADEIQVLYETSARALLINDKGSVVGVKAIGRGNAPMEIMARSTVLACGGFEGNPEMMSHYIGPQAQFIRPVSRGGHYNRGEGVRMALDAGAAPCGDFGSFHAQPVDPRSADIEPVVLNYSYGILVNDAGRRFTDEGPAMVDATYEIVTRLIMAQRHGIAYAVFDAGLDDVEN